MVGSSRSCRSRARAGRWACGLAALALLAAAAGGSRASAQTPLGPDPEDLEWAELESPDREPAAPETPLPSDSPVADAQPSARPAAAERIPTPRERLRALARRARANPRLEPAWWILAWLRSEPVRGPATAVLGALLFLVFSQRLLRGRGDLVVCLGYPEELRGTFRVSATTRRPKRRHKARPKPGDRREPASDDRAASRTHHPMVSRETRFRKLRSRSYTVIVDGSLRDPDSEEVLEQHYSEHRVRIRNRRTARLNLDLHPEECPVDVKVLWNKLPVREARVALQGRPNSARYARGGTLRLRLPMGAHRLFVCSGDRIAEHAVEISSFRASWAVIDLDDESGLMFKDCAAAVDPFMQGDHSGAARILEREGQPGVARRILARLDLERGRERSAAEHLEAAGDVAKAAEIWSEIGDYPHAAAAFERAGEMSRAAEMHRCAGDLLAAGEAYGRAQDWERAVACYREADDPPRLLEALERQGAYFEAAELAVDLSDWTRGIRNLQHIAPGHPRSTDACRLYGLACEKLGETDLAIQKFEEAIRAYGTKPPPLELLQRLAETLEAAGLDERALEVYEAIRRRDLEYPNIATRIETLRKKRSSERNTKPMLRTPTGAVADSDRYEILEEIGRGGMGVVYKARDLRLRRIVALKRLPENLRGHPKAAELFLREARAAAALNHTNIVTLFDADEDASGFFFTMELLEGHSLYGLLKRVGHVKPRDVARLGVQIANGLHYAHGRRIVHRDIKTGNLFFTHDRTVKIMDFGLAKMLEEMRRAVTVIAGTPYYMAPEQSAGESVDHRADLYALGVTFFELCTGSLPFEEGDVAFHHRHTAPPQPRERVADLPDELNSLIVDLMQKNPAHRPESAAEVARRLQELLRHRR